MKFFLCVIGMVLIIEGLPYFISPEKMKSYINSICEYKNITLRKMGFGLMIFGLLLIYLAQKIL